jgi:hypothetical protein
MILETLERVKETLARNIKATRKERLLRTIELSDIGFDRPLLLEERVESKLLFAIRLDRNEFFEPEELFMK